VPCDNLALSHVPVRTVFQSDGAPPPFCRLFHPILNREFSDPWTGRGEPILCTCSPDLTPMAIFFWEVAKGIICRENVQHMNELRDTILRAAESVTNEILSSTWRETECRLDVCLATNGGHIEICGAYDKLREAQCLKMYRFLKYTLWLETYVFFCNLRLDTCLSACLSICLSVCLSVCLSAHPSIHDSFPPIPYISSDPYLSTYRNTPVYLYLLTCVYLPIGHISSDLTIM